MKIKFKGNEISTCGTLPDVGSVAPDFTLTNADLNDVTLADFAGKKKVLNIVPSLDTDVCAMSAVKFNQQISDMDNAVLLNISADLMFASKRFCDAQKLENLVPLSTFRSSFGKDYGVEISDSPLRGLMSRAIVVLDEEDKVLYTEQVSEITQEPDYESAMAALK